MNKRKENDIHNVPDDSTTEHSNPQYLDLFLSAVTESYKTVAIVSSLTERDWR